MSKPIFQKFDCRILLISGNQEIMDSLEFTVAGEGYQYDKASDTKIGLAKLRSFVPDVVIVDAEPTDKASLKILNPVRKYKKYESVYLIFLTDKTVNKQLAKANNSEILMPKPVDFMLLKRTLSELFSFS